MYNYLYKLLVFEQFLLYIFLGHLLIPISDVWDYFKGLDPFYQFLATIVGLQAIFFTYRTFFREQHPRRMPMRQYYTHDALYHTMVYGRGENASATRKKSTKAVDRMPSFIHANDTKKSVRIHVKVREPTKCTTRHAKPLPRPTPLPCSTSCINKN